VEVANKRVAAAQQTRANLIETGLVLAEELGLEGLSVNAVVAVPGYRKVRSSTISRTGCLIWWRCTAASTMCCSTR